RVQHLELREQEGSQPGAEPAQAHERRVAYGLEYVLQIFHPPPPRVPTQPLCRPPTSTSRHRDVFQATCSCSLEHECSVPAMQPHGSIANREPYTLETSDGGVPA